MAFARAGRADDRHPILAGPPDRLAPEDVAAYVDKYGEPPRFEPAATAEEVVAALRAPDPADVALIRAGDMATVAASVPLAAMPEGALPNWADAVPGLDGAPGVRDGDGFRFVPTEWVPIATVARADLVPAALARETWALLWDPALKGRLAMPRDPALGALVAAAYAGVDGYAPSELEQARIEEALARQRPLLARYDDDPAALAADLASGALVAAVGDNALFAAVRPVAPGLAFLHPEEGPIVRLAGAVVRAGSPRLARAYEVVDAMLDPRHGVRRLRLDGVASANARAFGVVEVALLESLGLDRGIEATVAKAIFQMGQASAWRVRERYTALAAG
jgi:spermidine/putrescine transport system substrate-binding protein